MRPLGRLAPPNLRPPSHHSLLSSHRSYKSHLLNGCTRFISIAPYAHTQFPGESGFQNEGSHVSLRLDLYATLLLFVVSVASRFCWRMQKSTGAHCARFRVAETQR